MDKKLKKHKDDYIHIPKPSLYPLLGLIISSGLSYINFLGIKILFELLNIKIIEDLKYVEQLTIIPSLITQYVLVACIIISLTALIKGGYSKLKKYDTDGIIWGLIFGLIAGPIVGLSVGLNVGLVCGLIIGIIGGMINGLIIGMGIGLVGGLIGEFE